MKRIFLVALAAATLSISASAGAQEDTDTGQSPVPEEVAPAPVREGWWSWLTSWDSTATNQNSRAITDLQRRVAVTEECAACATPAPAPKPPPVYRRPAPKPAPVTTPAPAPVTTTTVAPPPAPSASPVNIDELTDAVVARIKENHEFATPADVRSVLNTNCTARPDVTADPLDPYNSLLCGQFRTLQNGIDGVNHRVDEVEKDHGVDGYVAVGGSWLFVPGFPSDALAAPHLGFGQLTGSVGWRDPNNGHGFSAEVFTGLGGGTAPKKVGGAKAVDFGGRLTGAFALDKKHLYELHVSGVYAGDLQGILRPKSSHTGQSEMFGGGVGAMLNLGGDHLAVLLNADFLYGGHHVQTTSHMEPPDYERGFAMATTVSIVWDFSPPK